MIVLPDAVFPWPITDSSEVSFDTLHPVIGIALPIEILLIGMGPKMRPASSELRQALKDCGIIADSMGTGAACRTFNVLVGEDRRVAAALIAQD